MKIIADQEAINTLTQASDALLKAYWNEGLWLANKILAKIEDIEFYDVVKKDIPETKVENNTKPKKKK